MNLMSTIEAKEVPVTQIADELWYKDAIIYQLHVKACADSNNDGIGDFAGLTEKLGYLQDLGVTALWLLPFYPSPGRDDGYDIADYGDINPDFGTLKDFKRFIQEAKKRGLKVITELVINHTSDQHDWFKRARRSDPKSSARNWYVWSDTDQKYLGTRIIFTDTEKSNWTWDPEAGQFYWHRFFSHQPDLNFDNPRVVRAIVQVMKRWLDAGVDGFRLDAIPYLCERDGTNNENLPETHAVIKKLRSELDAYAKGKVLLAEANQWPEDVQEYFGQGDECHMAYHFPLMPRIYMAIAQEDRFPITDILRQTPDIPGNCQWALFLRNHDELTLEMVTDVERDYLWSTYANDPRSRSLSSLLSWTKRLISVRKSNLAFGRGTMTFIRPANRAVLAYVRQYGDEVTLCIANLSRSAQATELDLSAWKDRIPLEMLGRTRFPAIGELPYMTTLGPYGFYWFQLEERDRSEHVSPSVVPEFETLVIPVGATWVSLARTRGVFERDVLPGFLARSRWYPERSPKAIHPRLTSAVPFCDVGDNKPWLAFFEATQRGVTARYVLPMQIEWVRFDRERYNPRAFAAVRQGAREGTLLDVATDHIFIALLLRNLREVLTVEENGLRLEFRPTSKFSDRPIRQPERIRAVETEQSNSTALVDNDYVVKIYRKLESGTNPEIEMGWFLTEVAGFANTPALLGSVEFVEGNQRSAIGIVHAFVENQGDGWTVTAAYLDRFSDEQRLLPASEHPGKSEELNPYLRYMSQTGRRVGEMHAALASNSALPDFAPEPTRPEDVQRWIAEVMVRAERVFEALKQRRDGIREADRALVDEMLAQRAGLEARLSALLPRNIESLNIRHHGDFHLGQMLIVKDDICIIDFEGEPRRPLAERRRKAPAARDVAGLIRSIDYSVTAALERALKVSPDEHGKLARALAHWRDGSADAFLAGYHEAMTNQRLWPADPRAATDLLNFSLLEKAFYEIEYELAHRPDWLRVPLMGMLRILSEPVNEAS